METTSLHTPFRAKITALGTYVPPRVLTNSDLEKMVETSNDWIIERTGIRERHIVDRGVATSDLATCAAKRALAERNLDPAEIECIVVGTVTPDMLFPATACLVQHKLGIPAGKAWGFDVSAACSGFLYALTVGTQFVKTGMHKKVLVIGADVNTSMVDYTDRAVCVLFGDGAGAVVLEPCADGEEGIVDFVHEIDGAGGQWLKRPGGGSALPGWSPECTPRDHYIHQDGQQVFKYAVRKMAEVSEEVLRRNGYTGDDVGCFIP